VLPPAENDPVPRFSLRTWILLPAWTLVTGLILVLSASQADTLITAWIRSSRDIAELAGQQVKQTLLRRLAESLPKSQRLTISLKEALNWWSEFIRTDPGLESDVGGIVGRGGAIVEVYITDQTGRVLTSSHRVRMGKEAVNPDPLSSLENLNSWARFRRLFSESRDFGYSVPIGLEDQGEPIFTIHVLVSNVLLREALAPGLRRIGFVSIAALVLSLALVYAVASFTSSNLALIGKMIDRIGDPADRETPSVEFPAAEFAAVGSKLNLLDTRVRDVLQDAQQYRNRVTAMLESLEEAILLFDDDRLVLAAGPAASLLGVTAGQIENRGPRNAVLAGTGLSEVIEACYATRRPVHDQTVRTTSGGRERRLIVNLDFISAPDAARPTALLRLRDAEGAGAVESQLKLSSRLEAINRLTGGVAHEIKNPLNAISARLSLLESIVAEDTPEAEEQIRTISAEIDRLDRVVRTFLDFTRPLEIARDRIDLAALGREVADQLRLDAARRTMTLTFEGAEDLMVYGDRDLLKQALMNVVLNGLEAMSAGGELRMRASADGGMARLSVTDTGPGIPEAQLEEIFKLYFTTKKNGSGIGLAVSYRTLQLHGGELKVESKAGEGSTFHLVLPMIGREDVVEEGVSQPVVAGAGTTL
jgi:signal transduction histidine kinase